MATRFKELCMGIGASSDGRGKSLWAPRKEGQVAAMERAYRGGLDMGSLQYVEAHATSTGLGDATELNSLSDVLSGSVPAGTKIPVTSVKANIGHTLEAAGIAGLIKTVLCMQHRTIRASGKYRVAQFQDQLAAGAHLRSAEIDSMARAAEWSAAPRGRERVRHRRLECASGAGRIHRKAARRSPHGVLRDAHDSARGELR